MGVTHIMRSDEFISSTPKFLALYDALGIERPHFATLPPIMAPDGKKKLGKRDGAKDILDYRADGYLPEAMFNFLAYIGWSPEDNKEILTPEEFIKVFELNRIHKSGGGFNVEKLDWINREYLKKLSYEEQEEYVVKFIPSYIKNLPGYSNSIIHNITPIIMERITKGVDIVKMAEDKELDYFFTKPTYDKNSLFFKSSKIPEENKYKILSEYLNKVLLILSSIEDINFNKEVVKEKIWPYTEEVGRGDILWPMRYALSGLDKSPDPFLLAEVLGKKEVLDRLTSAILILEK
jgi:glutamyl/glutaminyl-tRNA synthetase